MTIVAGTVWGILQTSHIYAIFKGEYLYFGETGHVPPVRWRSHLTSESDFIGKLTRVDPDEAFNGNPVFFVGIQVGAADAEPEARQKIARRAIEAELHRRFSLDPMPVRPARILLSSAPPVPVGHKFEFDKITVANAVYALIAEEYRKWLLRTGAGEVCIKINTRSGTVHNNYGRA